MARILIVDDDEQVRGPFARMLGQVGHIVLQASNGREALEVLRAHSVDAVVTDVVMPEMDGLELMIALRKEFPDLPVVVMSGSSLPTTMDVLGVARRLGARVSLPKPFRLGELLRAINGVIENKDHNGNMEERPRDSSPMTDSNPM